MIRTKKESLALAIVTLGLALSVTLGGCDNETNNSAPATQGPGRAVMDSPPGDDVLELESWINVRSGYTQLEDNGTHDVGRRGWAVPGPALEYTIENIGGEPLRLTGNPPVTVSNLHNVGNVSIAQPATTVLGPQQLVDFNITFTVIAQGPFAMVVTIPSDAIIGQIGPAFEFKISGSGAPELLYEQFNPSRNGFSAYVNGTAQGNTERGLPAGPLNPRVAPKAALSPNGAYFAYVVTDPLNGHVYVQSTSTGLSVYVTSPLFQGNQKQTDFAWAQDAAGNQLLAVNTNVHNPNPLAPSLGKRLYTCRISGTTPVVSNFAPVDGYQYDDTKRMVTQFAWSKDATRLGFIVAEYYVHGSGFSLDHTEMWASNVANAQPSIADTVVGAGGGSGYQFQALDWADASTLLFDAYETSPPDHSIRAIYAARINLINGHLVGSPPVKQTTDNAGYIRRRNDWAISPNGKRLAFALVNSSGHQWPHAVEIDTAKRPTPVALAAGIGQVPLPLYVTETRDRELSWAPDSRSVAFIGSREGEIRNVFFQRLTHHEGEVVLLGNTVQLTSYTGPDWSLNHVQGPLRFSPEGQRLMFAHGYRNQGYTTSASLLVASYQSNPTINPVASNLSWLGDYSFRPGNGSIVAYKVLSDLYVAPLGGGKLLLPQPGYRINANTSAFPGAQLVGWMR